MDRKKKRKIKEVTTAILGGISVVISMGCVVMRLPMIVQGQELRFNMAAASFILPCGEIKSDEQIVIEQEPLIYDPSPEEHSVRSKNINKEMALQTQKQDKTGQTQDDEGKRYKITETQFRSGGIRYNNFFVKNVTGTDLNIERVLKQKPDFKIKKNSSPQVLIVHTHTCEKYMDKYECSYNENYYPRTTDNNKNVTQVGNAIAGSLEKAGISTIHDLTHHDDPTYSGSYSRSADTIKKNLNKYPSIKVVLDIHRDGMTTKEKEKIKPTFMYKGKKAAQIMIMTGCDPDGKKGFPDWQQNLKLGLRLQQRAETMYPGITRPMFFGKVRYNMNLTHGSLLIEVGSDANTLDEAVYTGTLLGNALAKVLEDLQ